ncbi:MAG TPA: copper resistance protein CopC [Solirubrobacteraceae bacterium]|nr:copper resistance protein CopC [Solirubrobacteraceae bacterium]
MRRAGLLALGAAAALALPTSAWAHAALLRTDPVASRTINAAPPEVRLTYSEPVEPRFAIVSVTDATGRQVTSGEPAAAPGSPETLVTPLQRVGEGWYLVFWRVISADGHPVRGAFTFAIGPNPGPPPQFVVPSLSETATTKRLLVARWVVFLSLLGALGLFVLRALIARPVVRAVPGCSLRAVNIAFAVAVALALVATPVYVLLATAQFTLRSFWDLADVVPSARSSGFGRDFLDLELVLALFAAAAAVALFVDRPDRERRSVAELLALPAALASGAAALLLPALAGHAGQRSPRGLSLPLDTAHLAAASVWLGGLVGLVVLWLSVGRAGRAAALADVVPRFSTVAFCSVLLLVGTGIGQAFQELPTLASLWQTSYGQALIWKIALLSGALLLAAVNLARTKPRLAARDASAPLLLRRLVQGEIVLVVSALFAAGVLASLAPPSSALARVQDVAARVGPGPVSEVVAKDPYRVHVQVTPNRAAVENRFSVSLTRGGRPVRGAELVTRFDMLDMEMGEQSYRFRELRPGVFARSAPALVMVGHWALQFEVTPPGARPFVVTLLDKASG